MSTIERITRLDDPSRPWRRIYKSAGGAFVKVYVTERTGLTFGKRAWEISGSHCDERGSAHDDDGFLRVGEPHEVLDQGESDVDILALIEGGVLLIVERIERAARNRAVKIDARTL